MKPITLGSHWLVNGTTYRVETLDNGRAQYPITMVPVAWDEAARQRLETIVETERKWVAGHTEDTLAALRERLMSRPFDTELRWFGRVDVREVDHA